MRVCGGGGGAGVGARGSPDGSYQFPRHQGLDGLQATNGVKS